MRRQIKLLAHAGGECASGRLLFHDGQSGTDVAPPSDRRGRSVMVRAVPRPVRATTLRAGMKRDAATDVD